MEKDANIVETLKSLTVYDFILNCVGLNSVDSSESVVYTAKQLQSLYPKLFSKYKLDQAIKNEKLPYFKSGRERYFIKSEIEKWINSRNKTVR